MDNIRIDLQEVDVGIWTEFCWTRIRRVGGLL
jgi:hypothetical protein